jgi:hypothetical protein
MKMFFLVILMTWALNLFAQNQIKDTVVMRITYRDTTIYRYDTIRIKRYIQSDTLWNGPRVASPTVTPKKKGLINPNAWGIGPSVGAYYSPYNGFDINIGFGIQYYLLAIPSFRNPHLGKKRRR